MIYVHIGKNCTGQRLVACPHVNRAMNVDMFVLPNHSAVYEVTTLYSGRIIFQPSKKSIVVWCPECYDSLSAQDLVELRQLPLQNANGVEG